MLFSKPAVATLVVALLSVQQAAGLVVEKRAPALGKDGRFWNKGAEEHGQKENPNWPVDKQRAESVINQATDKGELKPTDNVAVRASEHTDGSRKENVVTAMSAPPRDGAPEKPKTTANHFEVADPLPFGGPPVFTGTNFADKGPDGKGLPNKDSTAVPQKAKYQGSELAKYIKKDD